MPATAATTSNVAATRSRSRVWRSALVIAVTAVCAGEAGARWGLGLGDPPLSVADPDVEYMFRPGTYHRFGHLVHYNQWSMRSEDFAPAKSAPDEVRVMVIGDSIINGGGLTDQRELATERLREWLRRDLGRAVVVGNISAGSWGPPNLLAYARKYGLFEADVVVVVLSSHDYADVPTFAPLVGVDPAYPDHAPLLALAEGVTRYLPRYLPASLTRALAGSASASSAPFEPRPEEIEQALGALDELVALIRNSGAAPLIAQHLDLNEVRDGRSAGYYAIHQAALAADVPTIDLGEPFGDAVRRGGSPYQDGLHPNAAGQLLLATALLRPIEDALNARDTHAAPAEPAAATSNAAGW